MRASDADREKYVAALQSAYAEGRLSHEEYEDRMSLAYEAVTFADLYPLLTDLPVDDEDLPLPPRVAPRQLDRLPEPDAALSPRSVTVDSAPAVAVFSEVRRGGRWLVPAEQTSVAVMGTLKIDLREALLESGSVRIQAVAVMGEIEIMVPDDVHLKVTGTGVLGEFTSKDQRSGNRAIDAPVGSPHIHITGAAILGSVTVVVVPSHEVAGSRILPQTGPQFGPPPANLPPANLPPTVQPPVQNPAVDGVQRQHQGGIGAADEPPEAPPTYPPAVQQPENPQQAASSGVAESQDAAQPRGPEELED
jgi:hypothetical protein